MNKGFGSLPTYTLKLKTVLGNYTIPYTVDRLSSQHKTDIRACAISRLIFGVLQYPDSARNVELLKEALPVESVEQVRAIGLELIGAQFTGTTYVGNTTHRIQIASTELIPGLGLVEQNLEEDVQLAS